MNKLINTIFFLVCWCYCHIGHTANEHSLPIQPDYFIESTAMEFKVVNDLFVDYFLDAYFASDDTSLNIETKYPISFLEILNDDYELECKIPVYTSKINLNLETFERGKYLLLLFVDGEPFPIATVFTKK